MDVTVATTVKKGLNRILHKETLNVNLDESSGALEIVSKRDDVWVFVYERDEWLSYSISNPTYPTQKSGTLSKNQPSLPIDRTNYRLSDDTI